MFLFSKNRVETMTLVRVTWVGGGLRGQAQGFLKERMSLTEKLYHCGIKIGPRKKENSGSTAAALFQSGKWKMQLPVNSMQAITLVLTSKSQQSVRKNRRRQLKVHFNSESSVISMCLSHGYSLYTCCRYEPTSGVLQRPFFIIINNLHHKTDFKYFQVTCSHAPLNKNTAWHDEVRVWNVYNKVSLCLHTYNPCFL